MLPFSTEFPIKKHDRSEFIYEIITWIKGINNQKILSKISRADIDGDNVHIKDSSGEELRIRELATSEGWDAIGFRYDLPDENGRIWRTECVLKRNVADYEQDLIRLRTQCLATKPGARLFRPRKPYLIKALLKNGWGGTDELLEVNDNPVYLNDNEEDILIASSIASGEATRWLPVIYISANDNNSYQISQKEIEKISYDVGGVAHVVVEPSRSFSFKLRDMTDGNNVYGGTIGLSIPGQGFVQRFFLGGQFQDLRELTEAIRHATITQRSLMPAKGWDWMELQEAALRLQREKEKDSLTVEEWEKLHNEEIQILTEKIDELENRLQEYTKKR